MYMASYHAAHKERHKELNRKYAARKRNDPIWAEQERKRGREFLRDLRFKVMDVYGGRQCVCCGETGLTFLTIDHVNNDGAAHRRSLRKTADDKRGRSGSAVLAWIKKNNFPPGFQVLCFNCNLSKHINGGICEHQLQKTELVA